MDMLSTRAMLTDREQRLLDLLTDAAERGAECPTNKTLGRQIGCSFSRTSEAVSRLEALGFISVERTRTARIVTVTDTGLSTAAPRGLLRDRIPDATLPARERLAELVAGGVALADVRKHLRLSSGQVARLWNEICAGLGPQAR